MNKLAGIAVGSFLFILFCVLGTYSAMVVFNYAYGKTTGTDCILYAIFFLIDMGYAYRSLDTLILYIKKKPNEEPA